MDDFNAENRPRQYLKVNKPGKLRKQKKGTPLGAILIKQIALKDLALVTTIALKSQKSNYLSSISKTSRPHNSSNYIPRLSSVMDIPSHKLLFFTNTRPLTQQPVHGRLYIISCVVRPSSLKVTS